jgi:hypothetical protein
MGAGGSAPPHVPFPRDVCYDGNRELMETSIYEEPDHRRGCLTTLLLGGILMTLPLYCGGVMLIAIHQDPTPTATPTPNPSTFLHLVTPTHTGTPTLPPTSTPTPSRTPFLLPATPSR